VLRAGESNEAEEEVSRRFSFSLSPEEEELPMLARDTRPFLLKQNKHKKQHLKLICGQIGTEKSPALVIFSLTRKTERKNNYWYIYVDT
jgi:hypothetical protein